MLCESVTMKVVKKPNNVCCDNAALVDIENPITAVMIRQTIETNDAVSSAKTILSKFYHVAFFRTGWPVYGRPNRGKKAGTRRM